LQGAAPSAPEGGGARGESGAEPARPKPPVRTAIGRRGVTFLAADASKRRGRPIVKTLIAALMLSALLGAAAAHAGTVHARQFRQHCRIEHGVHGGGLTRSELRALRTEQRKIDRIRHRALADGVIVPAEARQLDRAQDRASRHIYRLTRNFR
jgi:hypothetical protein